MRRHDSVDAAVDDAMDDAVLAAALARADEILDRRGDPLADPELAALCDARPDVADALGLLCARLDALATTALPAARRAPRRRSASFAPALASAAGVAFAALGAWALVALGPALEPARRAATSPEPSARVVDWRLEIRTESVRGTTLWVRTPAGETRSSVLRENGTTLAHSIASPVSAPTPDRRSR